MKKTKQLQKKQPFTFTKKSTHLLQLQYMLFSHKKKEKKVIRQWSYPVQKKRKIQKW